METAIPIAEKVYGEILTSAAAQELECAAMIAELDMVIVTWGEDWDWISGILSSGRREKEENAVVFVGQFETTSQFI